MSPITHMKPPSNSQNSRLRFIANCAQNELAPPQYTIASEVIIPNSPIAKNVTKESGFIPVRYAFRDVHGPPEHTRAQCSSDSKVGSPMRLSGRSGSQKRCAGKHEYCTTDHSQPAGASASSQLVKQNETPEDSQQTIRVPQWKRDAKPDVADSKDGERIRHCPNAARQKTPYDQVWRFTYVLPNSCGASQQRRQ